jgi:hypothetical protein
MCPLSHCQSKAASFRKVQDLNNFMYLTKHTISEEETFKEEKRIKTP